MHKIRKNSYFFCETFPNAERVFSVASNVVTPKQIKLNPEEVEDLSVVKCNLKLLKTMGFRK